MSEQLPNEPIKHEVNGRLRFIALIAGSIVVASLLVFLSLRLYDWSGASQLDFSLPTYDGMRQSIHSDEAVSFPSTGNIDQAAIDEFNRQFETQLKDLDQSKGFSSQALSDRSLGIKMPKQ